MLAFTIIILTLLFFSFIGFLCSLMTLTISYVYWHIFKKSSYFLITILNFIILIPAHLFYSGQITYTLKPTYKTGSFDTTFYVGFLLYLFLISSYFIHKFIIEKMQKEPDLETKNKELIKLKRYSYITIAITILTSFSCYFLSQPKIYNLGKFVKISDMNIPRSGQKSFLLSDGKVLIYGGNTSYPLEENGRTYIKNWKDHPKLPIEVEIYDPKTKAFTLKEGARKITRYAGSNAILLDNDKLLITGGILEKKSPKYPTKTTKASQIYDPNKDQVIKGSNTNIGRYSHTSIKLQDGRILIFGGKTGKIGKNWANNTAEIYDPNLNKFLLLNSQPKFVYDRPAKTNLLSDGRVFIAGTMQKNTYAEIFDPKTEEFNIIKTQITEPSFYGYLQAAITLNDDKIILFLNGKDDLNYIKIFDIQKNELKDIGHMNLKDREGYQVTLLQDKNILITGGYIGRATNTRFVKSSEIFNSEELKFYSLPNLNYKKRAVSAVLLNDGAVLMTGGIHHSKPQSSAELFLINKEK